MCYTHRKEKEKEKDEYSTYGIKKTTQQKNNPNRTGNHGRISAKTAEDMQEAIKDIFGPIFEAMLQGEMDHHLGYGINEHGYKDTDNRRNGYSQKNIKTSYGEMSIDVPRDRQATFEQRGYRVVRQQQICRQNVWLTNYIMEKQK